MVAVAAAHVITPTQTLSPGVVDIDESSGAIVDIASDQRPGARPRARSGLRRHPGQRHRRRRRRARDGRRLGRVSTSCSPHKARRRGARRSSRRRWRPTAHESHRSPTRQTRHATCPSIIGRPPRGPVPRRCARRPPPRAHHRTRPRLDRVAARSSWSSRPSHPRRATPSMRSRCFAIEVSSSRSGTRPRPQPRRATRWTPAPGWSRTSSTGWARCTIASPASSAPRSPTTGSPRRSSPTSSTCTLPRSASRSRRSHIRWCSSPMPSPGGAAPSATRPCGWSMARPASHDGTLAGSALTMDSAVANVVNRCGVSLEHAIRAASTTPAALLGLVDRGAIEVGRRADLVALDRDLRCAATWIGGTAVHG